MNKLLFKLGFPIFLLFNSSLTYSSQISKILIEGFSIGDSLLDFIEEDEILKQAKRTRMHYQYLKEPYEFLHIFI